MLFKNILIKFILNFSQAAVSFKISNLICFCSFDLSCPIREKKKIFLLKFVILYCLVLLTARVLLYASSHRQDDTFHSLCYTSHGALAGTRNNSVGPPHEGSIRRPIAP